MGGGQRSRGVEDPEPACAGATARGTAGARDHGEVQGQQLIVAALVERVGCPSAVAVIVLGEGLASAQVGVSADDNAGQLAQVAHFPALSSEVLVLYDI